jgi:hypothetical protein
MNIVFLTVVLLCNQQYLAQARTIYVDATSNNPANVCTGLTIGAACPTIESGLLLAESNDTVLIEPGLKY